MLHTLGSAFRQWRERRQAIHDLAAMPEHLLRDIGVERHAISDVVNGLQTRQRLANRTARGQQPRVDGRAALN